LQAVVVQPTVADRAVVVLVGTDAAFPAKAAEVAHPQNRPWFWR
jgi:hypothetical protein